MWHDKSVSNKNKTSGSNLKLQAHRNEQHILIKQKQQTKQLETTKLLLTSNIRRFVDEKKNS